MDVNREVPEMFVGILSDTPERLAYLDGAGISYSAVQTRTISSRGMPSLNFSQSSCSCW